MSKRQCPFENTCLPQLKIHISNKQYNLNDENKMSKIHVKTLQMLFNGMRKLNPSLPKIKQIPSSSDIEDQCIATNISEYCSLCHELNVTENKCSFCDKWICGECCGRCVICSDIFCVTHSAEMHPHDPVVCFRNCKCFNCFVALSR